MKVKPGDILICINGHYSYDWRIQVVSNDSYKELHNGRLIKADYIRFDKWEIDDTVWRLDEATMVDRILTKYQDEV